MTTETVNIKAPGAYRQLSEAEIALVNRINVHRAATAELVEFVQSFVRSREAAELHEQEPFANPARAAAIGQTELQTGFMWLARAVAAPTFF